jgi:hypothetical protein
MYSKPVLTCFKYQVYQYGSEAITYLSGYRTSIHMINQTHPHPSKKAAPPPPLFVR